MRSGPACQEIRCASSIYFWGPRFRPAPMPIEVTRMAVSHRICLFLACLGAALLVPGLAGPARGDELPDKYKEVVKKGLEYLAKQQFKDGHWGANGDQYPVSMTGLAGLAMLMEGSTIREGKY